MRNPFHFFRKNQKALLAVFGVLLMIVFTVGGVITSFFPQRAAFEEQDTTVVTIDGSPLTAPEIERLKNDSNLVAMVTGLAMARTQEAGGFPNPPAPPIAGLVYQPASGPNSPGGPARQEISDRRVIEDYLFTLEAQRLGVAVSDDLVREFMTAVTGGIITSDQYNQLLAEAQGGEGRVTYDQMFEMFRRTIQIQKTQRLLLEGIGTATPASAWVNYRNLNRTIDVELYPVKTADYLAKVTQKPSDAELRKLFDKYNDQIRNARPGEPGFLQLDKVAVSFMKADYQKFLEAELAKVSDEEVQKYYEENKDSSFRKPVTEPMTPPATEEKPAEEQPAEEKPAEDPAKMEAPATETPKTETPAEEKPATETPAEEKPASEEKPAEEKPAAEEKPTDEKPAAEESGVLGRGAEVMLVAFQEEAGDKEEKPAEEKPAGEAPATETPAEEKPAPEAPATETPATEPKAEAPAAEMKPMEEAAAPMGETTPAEEAPVEYRPLDEVKDQIKSSLARPRAQAAVKAALQKVADVLQHDYDEFFYSDDQTGTPFDKLDLKKLAQENGIEYGEIPMMDYIDAMESPYGQISHAEFSYNPQQGGLQRNDLRLIDYIFGAKAPLYRPQEFPGASSTSMFSMPADQQFVFWKTKEKEQYLPTFDDVRDEVLAAWKTLEASKQAQAEADKIAAAAKGDKPLNEVVPAKDAVIVDNNITYYQEIRQPGQFLPAEIPGVEKTSMDMLDAIFATPVGQTIVVPNVDKSIWYVARVTGERKSEAELRDQLKAEMNGEFPLSVSYLEAQRVQMRWAEIQEDLMTRFNLEWKAIPEN